MKQGPHRKTLQQVKSWRKADLGWKASPADAHPRNLYRQRMLSDDSHS